MRFLVAGYTALILSVAPSAGDAQASPAVQDDGERTGTVKVVGRFVGREGQLNGSNVLIADDFIVIGDWLQEGPTDDCEENPSLGAVYVLRKGIAFLEENAQKLMAPEGTEMRRFGKVMVTNGTKIAVAAEGRMCQCSQTAGCPKQRPNAVYVFKLGSAGRWELESTLVAKGAKGETDEDAGNSLAFVGDTLFVGSYQPGGERHAAGDQRYLPGGELFSPGVVYVFEWMQNSTWKQVSTIAAPEPKSGKRFAWSLAAEKDCLLVGQPEYRKTGAAFLFGRGPDGAWRLKDKLVPTSKASHCELGLSVALDSGSALIGNNNDKCPVFLYDLQGEKMKLAKVLASSPPSRILNGELIALQGGRAAIGVTGGVLLYRRSADGWKEVTVVSHPDGNKYVHTFPDSLALHGATLAVGSVKPLGKEDKDPNSVFFYALPAEWAGKQ
jgi:hypothetical protein